LRVGTIHIILLFSLLVGLAGCQNQNLTSLPGQEVSQLRIIVAGEGYYQITRKDWEKNGLVVHDLDQINLLYQGGSYPYWFNDEPDSNDLAIGFYSPPVSQNINLRENVFILSAEQTITNRRITPKKPQPAQNNFQNKSTGTFQEKYEQQSLYLPQVTGEDHWLWALFQPNQPISQEIQLPQEPVDHVSIRVQVWVAPTNAEHPAQQFSATINDQVLERVQVEAQGWQVIDFQLNSAYLNSKNHLTIQPVTSPDDLPAKIYLDWIEIEYSSQINLGTQFQSFTIDDSRMLTASNTSSGTLITIDNNQLLLDVYELQSGHQSTFTHSPDTTYDWIPDNQFLPVSSLKPIPKEVLSFPSQPIDYLVIAPKNFQQALAPLINLREAQGLATMMVSPQQIYDAKNAGTPSVDAIKEFVQSIYDYDPERLKYLLLAGDYTYEIVDYQEFLEYAPSFLISSGLSGEIVSDFPFADLNADLRPDLSVGRIPASTPEQVTAWVEKVILYEHSIPSDWNQIIAISDSSDPNFYENAQNFVLPMVNDHKTQVINAPIPGKIQEIFKSSYTLAAYFGHGSIDLWGKEKTLSISMLSELPKSSAPPVLISFSCLNGYFVHPEKLSLAEGLLFYPGGGVIGIFAPTGQTFMEDHEKLLQFFQNKLQSNDHSRIGNLIYHQKGENFPEDYSVINNFQTYIYFGDPAMLIP
jgi:hypothetical protein